MECNATLIAETPGQDYVCGAAAVDNCGVCDKDISNDCTLDCAGEWGGSRHVLTCPSPQIGGEDTTVCASTCPPVRCVCFYLLRSLHSLNRDEPVSSLDLPPSPPRMHACMHACIHHTPTWLPGRPWPVHVYMCGLTNTLFPRACA
eukprot:SAG11_NODE_808_length_7088_cov_5.136357_4_plen_146_part_00